MDLMRDPTPSSLQSVRFCLVDECEMVRSFLKSCLEERCQAVVVAEAVSLEALLLQVPPVDFEFIVTEVGSCPADTSRQIRGIKAQSPHVKILVLTAQNHPDLVASLLEAGSDGYFLKTGKGYELLQALWEIQQGRVYIHPPVAGSVVQALRSRSSANAPFPLTVREREVLVLLAQGSDTAQICRALCLTRNTVKTHLRTLYKKLSVTGRTQAVLIAIREGLV